MAESRKTWHVAETWSHQVGDSTTLTLIMEHFRGFGAAQGYTSRARHAMHPDLIRTLQTRRYSCFTEIILTQQRYQLEGEALCIPYEWQKTGPHGRLHVILEDLLSNIMKLNGTSPVFLHFQEILESTLLCLVCLRYFCLKRCPSIQMATGTLFLNCCTLRTVFVHNQCYLFLRAGVLKTSSTESLQCSCFPA